MLVVLTEYKVPRELGTLNYIYIFFNWNLGERQQCNTQTQRKLFCVIVQECFDYFADYTTKKIDSTKNRSSHNRSKKSIILAVWIDYCQNRLKIGNTSFFCFYYVSCQLLSCDVAHLWSKVERLNRVKK
jgi:hypothetical protein